MRSGLVVDDFVRDDNKHQTGWRTRMDDGFVLMMDDGDARKKNTTSIAKTGAFSKTNLHHKFKVRPAPYRAREGCSNFPRCCKCKLPAPCKTNFLKCSIIQYKQYNDFFSAAWQRNRPASSSTFTRFGFKQTERHTGCVTHDKAKAQTEEAVFLKRSQRQPMKSRQEDIQDDKLH